MIVKTLFYVQLLGCGGILTHPDGSISTPNYPNSYPAATVCEWTITTDYGKSINITFEALDIETTSDCSYDFIEARNHPFQYTSVTKYCYNFNIYSSISDFQWY